MSAKAKKGGGAKANPCDYYNEGKPCAYSDHGECICGTKPCAFNFDVEPWVEEIHRICVASGRACADKCPTGANA